MVHFLYRVEQQQVAQPASGYNVPGAVIGAVLGGVLGHQVGGGRGKDLATVGGVVAGARFCPRRECWC